MHNSGKVSFVPRMGDRYSTGVIIVACTIGSWYSSTVILSNQFAGLETLKLDYIIRNLKIIQHY